MHRTPSWLPHSQQFLKLMRELADALQQAQSAVLAHDLNVLQQQTTRGQELCQSIRELVSPPTFGSGPSPTDELAWQELQRAAECVGHSNRVLGALLRRARRSVEILARAQASRANTYLPALISRAASSTGRLKSHV